MKKYFSVLFSLLVAIAGYSQSPVQGGSLQNYIEGLKGTQIFSNQAIDAQQPQQDLATYLQQNFLAQYPKSTSLKLACTRQSPEGAYYTYALTFSGKEVYGRQIKAFIDKSSTIRWVYHNFETINNATSLNFLSQQQISSFSQSNYPALNLLNSVAVWVQHQNEILPSFYLTLQNSEQQITNQLVFASNGELLYTNKLDMHMAADTPAYAYVYDPDPLTTAHQEYGGQYANNNGADNAELQAELKKRIIRGTLQGDSVILANNNFYIEEITGPVWPPTRKALGDTFRFLRSEYSFAEVNAFYHLNTQINHVHSLGYNLPNFRIQVDAHAFSTENSQFSASNSPPALLFGDGGIADGEDAEVVVHEFGHALSFGAAPNTAIGQERRAIDEGLGDYFAVSYSKIIDSFNWTKVFGWDGNNGGWRGRTIDYGNKYPNLTNSIWTDGQLWSTAFIRIYDQLGREKSDKLMLGTLYRLASNINMPQLAQAVLQVDSIQNGGANTFIIQCAFASMGILDRPAGCTLSVQDINNKAQGFCTVYNSFGFANGEDLQISFNQTGKYVISLTDAAGKAVYNNTTQVIDDHKQIRGQNFAPGIYFLVIKNQELGQTQVFKLIRY